MSSSTFKGRDFDNLNVVATFLHVTAEVLHDLDVHSLSDSIGGEPITYRSLSALAVSELNNALPEE